jgi:phage protein D
MKPAFSVVVNDTDYTDVLADRMQSLTLTDAKGRKSDLFELHLDDRLPGVAFTGHGATMKVSIGYAGGPLVYKGSYKHLETEFEGPPLGIVIRGTATNFSKAIRSPRTRAWPDAVTLGDVVTTIAGFYDYQARVTPALAAKVFQHIDQVDESDVALLKRLAGAYDGVAFIKGGSLGVIEAGANRNALNQLLPSVTLRPEQVSNWSVSHHDTTRVGAIVAKWHDFHAAQIQREQYGDGAPTIELADIFPDAEKALAAAYSEYQRRQRANVTGNITMPGDPDLMTEGRLVLESFRDGVDGEYTITQVKHVIDKKGGYKCMAEFEQKSGIASAATSPAGAGNQ